MPAGSEQILLRSDFITVLANTLCRMHGRWRCYLARTHSARPSRSLGQRSSAGRLALTRHHPDSPGNADLDSQQADDIPAFTNRAFQNGDSDRSTSNSPDAISYRLGRRKLPAPSSSRRMGPGRRVFVRHSVTKSCMSRTICTDVTGNRYRSAQIAGLNRSKTQVATAL